MDWSALALLALAAGASFLLGLLIGMRRQVRRQVDAVLRRETRFRHPVSRDVEDAARRRAEHIRSVFMPERSAEGLSLGVTVNEATGGLQPLSEALRTAMSRPICGRDVTVPVPAEVMPCLRDPGHDGECQ